MTWSDMVDPSRLRWCIAVRNSVDSDGGNLKVEVETFEQSAQRILSGLIKSQYHRLPETYFPQTNGTIGTTLSQQQQIQAELQISIRQFQVSLVRTTDWSEANIPVAQTAEGNWISPTWVTQSREGIKTIKSIATSI